MTDDTGWLARVVCAVSDCRGGQGTQPNPPPSFCSCSLQGEENENENRLHPTPEIRGHPSLLLFHPGRQELEAVGRLHLPCSSCRLPPARHYSLLMQLMQANKQAAHQLCALQWSGVKRSCN